MEILAISIVAYFLVAGGILAASAIWKKIRQCLKFNEAMINLKGEDPLLKLFHNEFSKRDYFKAMIQHEASAYNALSVIGKIKHHLSNKEAPSTTFIRQYYAKKRGKNKDEDDGFSQARSAYRVLKTASVRNRYQQVIVQSQFSPCIKAQEEAYHVISLNPPPQKVSLFSSMSQFFIRIKCSLNPVQRDSIPLSGQKVEPITSTLIFRGH